MIIWHKSAKVGDVLDLVLHPLTWERIRHSQLVKVIRMSSRDEFIEYWQACAPLELAAAIKIGGEPPAEYNYVEVSTD